MIKIVSTGKYKIFQTPRQQRLLILGHRAFDWTNSPRQGELLITHKQLKPPSEPIGHGRFRIYKVKNEPTLIDSLHLELSVSKHRWLSYLLPKGLPSSHAKQTPIETSSDTISTPKG